MENRTTGYGSGRPACHSVLRVTRDGTIDLNVAANQGHAPAHYNKSSEVYHPGKAHLVDGVYREFKVLRETKQNTGMRLACTYFAMYILVLEVLLYDYLLPQATFVMSILWSEYLLL